MRPFIIKMTPPRQSGVGGRRSLKSCPPAGFSLSQYHLSTCPEQLVPFAASFPGQLGALPIAQTTQPGTEMLRCFSHSESWWQKTHPASSRLSIPISTLKWCTETSVQMNHLLISYQILANKEPSLVLAMLPNVIGYLSRFGDHQPSFFKNGKDLFYYNFFSYSVYTLFLVIAVSSTYTEVPYERWHINLYLNQSLGVIAYLLLLFMT